MKNNVDNIFSQIHEDNSSSIQSLKNGATTLLNSLLDKIKSLSSSIKLNPQTQNKISQGFNKSKQFFIENKELILGISVITALFVINQKRMEKHKNKSTHIHTLTSSPNNSMKRAGSNKKQPKSCQNLLDIKDNAVKNKKKNNSNVKLIYLKPFISEEQQQEEDYIRSQQDDKQNGDISASTRRTESIMSDIQTLKKKKKRNQRNYQPMLQQVEEQDQTQDRVFFQMFKTYRDS